MKKIAFSGLLIIFTRLLFFGVMAQDDATVQQILALTNQARNQAGLASLLSSAELTTAAQRHSDDMASADKLTHTGTDGSQFWQRMSDAGYTLLTGGENVLYRFDSEPLAVYQQWENSPPHYDNMMNPDFVEVGLAYTRADDGKYYFTMVLGARAGVTPPPLSTATPVPMLPSVTPFIETATDIAPDGGATATIQISTLPPIATNALSDPVSTQSPQVASTPITITAAPSPDIRLRYSDERLTLINISGRDLNLDDLSFTSASGELALTAWTSYMSQPLFRFPADACVQVMLNTTDGNPVTPADCDRMKGWLVIFNDSEDFWRGIDVFAVANGDNRVALCDARAGICEFSLSEQTNPQPVAIDAPVEVAPIQPTATVSGQADLQLIYNVDRFTIVNISGGILNLDNLSFESASGSLATLQWTQYMSQTLYDFPADYCLQALVKPGEPMQPDTCTGMRGWLVLFNDRERFWLNTSTFDVLYNGFKVATCDITIGQCEVDLP